MEKRPKDGKDKPTGFERDERAQLANKEQAQKGEPQSPRQPGGEQGR